ncbi:MAG: class I SAM-dependent methyltransferase, partial [bacterium]
MNWKFYNPKFEYENKFEDSSWPWVGHRHFAYDLISNIKPKIVVELGTHYGTSLWSFSQAIKNQNLDTRLYAIDTWEGEKHTGFYGEDVFETVKKIKENFYSNLQINLIRKTFNNALVEFENNSIDILHIDGLHTYEAVKNDFENWLPKMQQNGIILLHDIKVTENDFGVYKFWEQLKEKY